MLQKNKSSKLSKFKFLLVIPLMLAMLTYVACSEETKQVPIEEKMSLTEKIADLEAALEAKEELTAEEKEQFSRLLIKRSQLMYGKSKKASDLGGRQADNSEWDNKDKVPFAVIEKVPAFTGCEQYLDDVRKNCTSTAISNFVNKNFDTSLGKKLGLTGVNRVIVQFRIDETGNIADIRARAPHPELEEEAKRVISSLPQMEPGEQNGQPISVMYSLPIAFKVN